MSYSYYRTAQPSYWGTAQYHFPSPPTVSYVPQAGWTSRDFYNAHSSWALGGNADSTVFDFVWSKVKNMVGVAGMGREEARFWHRQVYSGMVNLNTVLPSDLGGAAAFEALRFFEHQHFYNQSSYDIDREREAVMGLAIAEATKLWSYTGRPADRYGRLEACEIAAATARRLLRNRYDPLGFGLRRRRGSYSAMYDDDLALLHHPLHRRRSSSSYHYRPSAQALLSARPYVGGSALALTIPSNAYSAYGNGYATTTGGLIAWH
ncbi:hypothetical protein CALVIDRAFT_540859 [Calocera viscosa TUFC12733]|uniref:Uncharacterized protein n=1 Tax=Calocera viscosa (strain TUFC12733) TaxID=1330018 RepID=A0A167IFE5_CALVF|nr:hypothetical protein CALVIDRAFT_540859 [Calocera viscosa TUFC12733]